MLIAALFIIAKTWKQPRYPSRGEWMKELWHIWSMKYYLAIYRHEWEFPGSPVVRTLYFHC